MSRRLQITFTDAEYEWLTEESRQSSVPVAELVRRAVDDKYPIGRRGLFQLHELNVRLSRRWSSGRRAGVRF